MHVDYILSSGMMEMKMKSVPHQAHHVGRHQVPLDPSFPSTFKVLRDRLTDSEFVHDQVEGGAGRSDSRVAHKSLLDVLDYLCWQGLTFIQLTFAFTSSVK